MKVDLAMKKGPSFSVVVVTTPARSRAKKDGPHAQDHTISIFWQAVFSSSAHQAVRRGEINLVGSNEAVEKHPQYPHRALLINAFFIDLTLRVSLPCYW